MLFGTTSRGFAALVGLFLSAAVAPAQTLSVSPSPVLTVGQTATVTYKDPARANTQITVEISGGFPLQTHLLRITLDGDGKGSGTWTVADWVSAYFDAPGVTSLAMPIEPPPF